MRARLSEKDRNLSRGLSCFLIHPVQRRILPMRISAARRRRGRHPDPHARGRRHPRRYVRVHRARVHHRRQDALLDRRDLLHADGPHEDDHSPQRTVHPRD